MSDIIIDGIEMTYKEANCMLLNWRLENPFKVNRLFFETHEVTGKKIKRCDSACLGEDEHQILSGLGYPISYDFACISADDHCPYDPKNIVTNTVSVGDGEDREYVTEEYSRAYERCEYCPIKWDVGFYETHGMFTRYGGFQCELMGWFLGEGETDEEERTHIEEIMNLPWREGGWNE